MSENTRMLKVYSAHWIERVMNKDHCTPNLLIRLPMKKLSTKIGREIKLEIEFEVSRENPALISSYS